MYMYTHIHLYVQVTHSRKRGISRKIQNSNYSVKHVDRSSLFNSSALCSQVKACSCMYLGFEISAFTYSYYPVAKCLESP